MIGSTGLRPYVFVLALGFLGLAAPFRDFAMDDAFIAFQYSKHLAEGHGLVWNPGEDPVEGYTSFLWVVIHSGAILVGADPLVFSKAFSIVVTFAILAILARACRRMHFGLATVLLGSIALSPAFALLAMQGLETALSALCLLLVARESLRIAEAPRRAGIVKWYAFALASALCRPDAVPFLAGAFVGLVALLAHRRDRAIRDLAVIGVPFLVVGGAYFAWRVHYFGFLFPNPFYIKLGTSGGVRETGIEYVRSFFLRVAAPYIVLVGALYRAIDTRRLLDATPVLAGGVLFFAYLLTIDPIQGYLWRFVFPAVPALVLAIAHALDEFRPPPTRLAVAVAAAVVVFFAAWTIRLLPEALQEQEMRGYRQMQTVGLALADLDGTMLTSASGALPYFSGWRSIDKLGLNSEQIAHQGLSLEILESVSPDLVTVTSNRSGRYRPQTRRHDAETFRTINDYMIGAGFVSVAAIRSTGGRYRHYFARRDSELFEPIVERLLDLDLEYGDLTQLMREPRIPIHRR